MNKCIYKKEEDLRFKKVEHVVPAGLGGINTLPQGYVSDEINEFFSALEAKALRQSLVAGIRNFVGPGHRGRMTVSKKLNPHMNILKLNKMYSGTTPEIYKYKIGFMLDRKTVFLPQILCEFSTCLDVENIIYSPGGFKNVCNNINIFFDKIDLKELEKAIRVKTEHTVGFNGIILGWFYDRLFYYSNIPFVTISKLYDIITESERKDIEINLSYGGKYDFSYRMDGELKMVYFNFCI